MFKISPPGWFGVQVFATCAVTEPWWLPCASPLLRCYSQLSSQDAAPLRVTEQQLPAVLQVLQL